MRSAYGSTFVARRSTVPALSIASISCGSDIFLRARDAALDPVGQRLRAVDRAVAEVVVGRARAARLLVVPVDEIVLVDHLRMRAAACSTAPCQVRVPVPPLEPRAHREVRVRPRRPHRVVARVEVGDVLVVDVEPVERVADLRGGALEVGRRLDRVRVVEVHEAARRVDLVEVGRAQLRERDRLAVDRAARGRRARASCARRAASPSPGGVSSAAFGAQVFVFSSTRSAGTGRGSGSASS